MSTKNGANFDVFPSRLFCRHVKEMDRERFSCGYIAVRMAVDR